MSHPTTSVADAIRLNFDGLTRAQQRLAEYVLSNIDDVAFMAARQLADATGSSDAAVIRFAQALGFRGFMEMRATLREQLLDRAGSSGLAKAKAGTPTPQGLVDEVFQLDQALIQQTAALNDPESYEEIAKRLCSAERVWIVAHGTSLPLGLYLAMLLNQILGQVRILTIAEGDLAGELHGLSSLDAVIGIGYVRYLPYTIDLMRLARLRDASVFAITDKQSSPLAQIADHSVFVARDGVSFAVSQSGTLAVCHALIATVARLAPERLQKRLEAADQLLSDLGLWAQADDAPRRGRPRKS
jgi:DNA-binding MurR/RpiR family transcriptional regulator